MHRAFESPEIADWVCRQLDPDEDSRELAALARTGKVFHESALNALWWHQDTIMNLIRCMPPDLWEPVDVDVSTRALTTLRLTRPVIASDWDRVLKYSDRVRSLAYVEHAYDPRFPYLVPILEALHNCVPGNCLLPNLEFIDWNLTGPTFPFVEFFFGPRISSISIGNYQSATLLATIASRYPALASVDLHSVDPAMTDSPQLYDARSALACSLTMVQSVKMDTIDLAAFRHLGKLETLETLHIEIPAFISFDGFDEQSLFTHLRDVRLDLRRGDILQLIALLRTWNNTTPLESFSASLSTYPAPGQIDDLYSTFADRCLRDSLQVLNLELGNTRARSGHSAASIRHLFPFANLVVLSIHVPAGFDFDDATIADMACAWPYLEELLLKTDKQPSPPRATLRALQSLSENCPDLRKLEITLDASRIPSPRKAPEARHVPQESLVSLAMGCSPIDSAFGVARFLSCIFINVAELSYGIDDDGDATARAWREVGVLLPGLVEIREEEWRHGVHFARQVMARSTGDDQGENDEGEGIDE